MIRKNGLKNTATNVRALNCKEAWFYENAKSVDVYVRVDGQNTLSCRIRRAALADWLKRTTPR